MRGEQASGRPPSPMSPRQTPLGRQHPHNAPAPSADGAGCSSQGCPLPLLLLPLPNVVSLIHTLPLLPTLLIWPEAAQSFKKKKGKRKEKQVQGRPGWQAG